MLAAHTRRLTENQANDMLGQQSKWAKIKDFRS